ncbi:LuxR family transcriptional regulator [Actinomycetospora sp. TBRC 11914]|uniref:helix-turn-helix transcriptional regulator n=1 Tax=Actinomycetospora sp. TBRC 11914 TaxID=2729387 RepID=UPI00145DFF70|nr:LuxR family transcriptional regulator [Actinomycetospora sp. TBRC 11914]NMO93799.1 AAA family ATPase [Actinomycetospora sp. TBRC 11914]
MARQWPFVGRERELAAVRKALGDGQLTGVVLVGPPGVGKTRLARAVAEHAESGGAAVRWVMATRSASGIPLGAMGQLLAAWDGPGSHAVHLLPNIARHLVDGAAGRRLVLAVDDAHLLDATSAALIHHLAVTGAASVVITARTGVTVPDPIFALWKEGLAERIDIHGLARAQSDELVRQVLDGQVDGATLHHLWELSLGNMLFLRELVEGGLASGALGRDADVWRWKGPLVPSPRLTELIDARMGSLEADEQAVLELLAFGEPLGADTPERVVGPDALSAVERKGLVVSERQDRRVELRLAHPLYGEVLRQRTSPRREKTVYRQLAESLEAAGVRRSGDRLRAVTWRLAAGLPTDAEMLRVAAESTMKVDYGAAERLARAAVEQGGGYAASVVLGQVLIGLGRSAEAEDLFAGLWFRDEDPQRRTELAVTRVTNLYWGLGLPARAATVLRDLSPEPPDDQAAPELAALDAALFPPYDGAKQTLQLAADLRGVDGAVDATRLQALAVASAALRRTGRHDVTVRVAVQAREAVAATPPPLGLTTEWAHLQLDTGCCESHVFTGRLDEAERLAREGYQRAVADGHATAKALHAGWLGVTAGLRGTMRTSLRWLRDATTGVRPDGLPLLVVLWSEIIQSAVVTGDLDGVPHASRQLQRVLGEGGNAYAPWAGLAPVWTAVAGGRLREAERACLAAADHAERDGLLQAHLVALHTAVRLGTTLPVADRLESAATGADGPLAAAFVDHARAHAAADAAALDRAADGFAALGARLFAAEAAAQASALHRARGVRGGGNASALRARAWAQECEGARTPALGDLDSSSELTRREHEIASLAASGMTSRAIAEHLVVSVRTVDNVLHVVYSKLGISGRRDLGSVVIGGSTYLSE